MTEKSISLWIEPPLPTDTATILNAFRSRKISIKEEKTSDCIVVIPSRLLSGQNPLDSITSHVNSGSTVVGFVLRERDFGAYESMKRTGALCCIPKGTSPDIVYSLINSNVNELQTVPEGEGAQTRLFLSVLHALDEGIIVLSQENKIIFFNGSAEKSLGASLFADSNNRGLLEQKLTQLLTKPWEPQSFEFRSFSGAVRAIPVTEDNGARMGAVMSFIDKRSVQSVSDGLAQGERTHALMLLTTSVCMKLLKTSHLGSPTRPLEVLEKALIDETQFEDLQKSVSAVTEILDLVLPPLTQIKISTIPASVVALSPSKLFKLIGFLLFQAVEYSGAGGDVIVQSERVEHSGYTTLIVSARALDLQDGLPYELVMNRIKAQRNISFDASGSVKKLPFGLAEIRNILTESGGTFKYRELDERTVEYIVHLPHMA